MARYLIELSLEPHAADETDPPIGLTDSISAVAVQLGGEVVQGWRTEGRYDLVTIVEFPSELGENEIESAFSQSDAIQEAQSTALAGLYVCAHGVPSTTGDCEHRPM
jgi:uncharacterized protein with GYD domain